MTNSITPLALANYFIESELCQRDESPTYADDFRATLMIFDNDLPAMIHSYIHDMRDDEPIDPDDDRDDAPNFYDAYHTLTADDRDALDRTLYLTFHALFNLSFND